MTNETAWRSSHLMETAVERTPMRIGINTENLVRVKSLLSEVSSVSVVTKNATPVCFVEVLKDVQRKFLLG